MEVVEASLQKRVQSPAAEQTVDVPFLRVIEEIVEVNQLIPQARSSGRISGRFWASDPVTNLVRACAQLKIVRPRVVLPLAEEHFLGAEILMAVLAIHLPSPASQALTVRLKCI